MCLKSSSYLQPVPVMCLLSLLWAKSSSLLSPPTWAHLSEHFCPSLRGWLCALAELLPKGGIWALRGEVTVKWTSILSKGKFSQSPSSFPWLLLEIWFLGHFLGNSVSLISSFHRYSSYTHLWLRRGYSRAPVLSVPPETGPFHPQGQLQTVMILAVCCCYTNHF